MTLMVLEFCTATGNLFSFMLLFYDTLLTLFSPEGDNSYQESNKMTCMAYIILTSMHLFWSFADGNLLIPFSVNRVIRIMTFYELL